jgi:hypothetical protein
MRPILESLPTYPGIGRKIYAGIGSRNTPPEVLQLMTRLARRLYQLGYTLRSGRAKGADMAFETGTLGGFVHKRELFVAEDARGDARAIGLVHELHPNPGALSQYAELLMARNTYQIFGRNLDVPVDFVLCWTPDGCEHHQERSSRSGGTGQAISLASLKGIPVINLGRPGWEERIKPYVITV